MDQVVAQVRSLAENGDEAARKTIIDTLRNLSYSLESPQDTMQRISYLVRYGRVFHRNHLIRN